MEEQIGCVLTGLVFDDPNDDLPQIDDVVLLPCPFCWSDASYCTSEHDHGIDHIATCNDCPARIETGRKELTVSAWNNRSEKQ